MEGVEGVSDRVKNIFGAIAVAAEAMVVAAVKFTGDFEASMDRVSAATEATGDALKAITDDIKELSRGTIFDYAAVASAVEKLVQGGHDVEDALHGIVGAAQDLAGITGENLDAVAQSLGRAIKVFDDSGRKPQEYADLFAQAITSIGVSMEDLSDAVTKLSPIVTQGGDDLETLLAALELLDQRGVSVGEAVNGLSRAFAQFELIKVGEVTEQMSEALERMGPAVQEATEQVKAGKMTFIELLDVIADYEPAFGDLVAVFGQFGAKAIDKLLPALKDSTDSFGLFKTAAEESVRPLDDLVAKFKDVSGAAESIRETVQDNLPSAFSKLGTSIKNLLVDLVGGTEALTGFVTKISEVFENVAAGLSEHGGLGGVIKEAFIWIGEEIFREMQALADNFVHFWTVTFPESITKALKTVWNTIAEGLATFFEKIPVIGQSMADFMRGKEFEIELQTDIAANIKLGDVAADADKVDVTGRDISAIAESIKFPEGASLTISGPSIADFTGTNLSMEGLGLGTVASSVFTLDSAVNKFYLDASLVGEAAAKAAQAGFSSYALSQAELSEFVNTYIEETKRLQAEMDAQAKAEQARREALTRSLKDAMEPVIGMFGQLLGPLSPLVDAIKNGTFGLRTFTEILVNLIVQSDGFRRLIAEINRLLQPVADALGWIFGALADAIEKALGEGKTSGGAETATEGMAAGGYTFGPTTSVAGAVHGGEWVAPARMVRQYPATFRELEGARRGYQEGGFVGNLMRSIATLGGNIASLLYFGAKSKIFDVPGWLADMVLPNPYNYPADEFAAVRMFMQKNEIRSLGDATRAIFHNLTGSEYEPGERLNYIGDPLRGYIDLQQDAAATLIRGGGDCDDFARLNQVILHLLGYDAYQVTVPSHSFAIARKGDLWHAMDYSRLVPPEQEGPAYLWDVLDSVMRHTSVAPVEYAVLQDINGWPRYILRPPGVRPFWEIGWDERQYNPADGWPARGYDLGGLTQGAPREIAGVVHGGEWVAPAWMVARYPTIFSSLEGARRGYQTGGYVGDVATGGGYKTLTNAIQDAADQVVDTIDRTGSNVEEAIYSVNIPAGYKLARAAWGVAAVGQPWFAREPSEPSIPGIPGGGEEPPPTPEPPSAPEPGWLTGVREFIDDLIEWIKPGIDFLVDAFKWFDNFLKNLGLEEPVRALIELFLGIVATQSAWRLLKLAVSSATDGVVGLVAGMAKFAGDALWGAIKAAGTAIWGVIQAAGTAIWGAIQTAGTAIWGGIQTAGTAIWGAISSAGLGIWVGIAAAAVAGLVAFGPQIVGFIQGVFSGIGDFLINMFGGVGQAIVSIFEIVLMPLKWIMNALIGIANGIISAINWALGWAGVNIPSIPYLEKGGHILEEGLAYLHRGETVVPARATPYGGQSITIQQMTVVANDPEEFMEKMEEAIRHKNLRGIGKRYGSYATAGA